MSGIYTRFLKHMVPGGLILDAGSGSGRIRSPTYIRLGYVVEAFDASPELCRLSSARTGVRISCLRFQDFDCPPRYDGIWACASLLHVPLSDLNDALSRLAQGPKSAGAFYMSFKYGSGERVALDGCLFVDMDERGIQCFFAAIPEMTITDLWRSGGEGANSGKDNWLNVIAVKPPRK